MEEKPKAQGNASAMLEAIQEYNKGNICFEQLELVYHACDSGLMMPLQAKAIKEFKKQLDEKATNN